MTHFPGDSAARNGYSGGRCAPCGKWLYISRKAARRARVRVLNTYGVLNAYPCPHADGWHLGHLRDPVGARDRIRAARERRTG